MTAAAAKRKKPVKSERATQAELREEKILKHLPLVRAIANRVKDSLPVQVELDDLAHAGVLGLFDAVDKYREDKNVAFHLYAKHRIRGAILDSLRQLDWASRDQRKRYKAIDAAMQASAQQLGRSPTEGEVARELGLTEDMLIKQKRDLQAAGLTSGQPHRVEKIEHVGTAETAEATDKRPDELFAHREMRSALNRVVGTLPPRYQTVIRMYYSEERTMKQIGQELGVNESRVSQIHKAALQKLQTALHADGYEEAGVFLEEPAA